VLAQSTGDLLTLERAIDQAAAANRLTKIATLEERKATAAASALHAQRGPRLDLKTFAGGFLSPLDFSFQQGAFGTYPATGPIPFQDITVASPRSLGTAVLFTAIQPITQLKRIAMGEKLFALERDLDVEKTREQRQNVTGDVRRTYYGLIQTRAGLVAVGQALAQIEELTRVVEQYVQRQVALDSDLLSVRTERARAEHSRLVLRNQEQTLKERLNLLMGRPLLTPLEIAPLPDALPADADLDAAVAASRRTRPAIRQATINVSRAEQDLALKERERLPDVSLAFGFARLFNVAVLPPTTAAAAVLFTWEPFDWGRRRQEAVQRGHVLEQARLAQQEAEAQVELDVRVKARKAIEARDLLNVARLARETAAERLRVATERYRVESALLRDVLEAQTALARSTQEYEQAVGAFWTARADFEQAIGDQP
jgi:outer membrane protein